MQANYTQFIDRVISKYEGGYGWNRKDPGGPTKYGITCFDLAEHRGQAMHSMSAWAPIVQAMSLAEAEDIYRKKYAVAVRFDELPSGVDAVMGDYAINSGASRPILVARAMCGLPRGGFDSTLLNAIKAYGAEKFINDMCDERLRFMHAIKGGSLWNEFGVGWSRRVADLRAYCIAKAKGLATKPADDLSKVPTPKAKAVPKKGGGTTGSVLGPLVGTATHAAGFDWTYVIVAVVAVVALGAAYEIWQRNKVNKTNTTPLLTGALPSVPAMA